MAFFNVVKGPFKGWSYRKRLIGERKVSIERPDGKVVAQVAIGAADKLVLLSEGRISNETCDRLRNHLDGFLSDPSKRVIVLSDGLRLAVIHMPPGS
jgi:hypothetical protein